MATVTDDSSFHHLDTLTKRLKWLYENEPDRELVIFYRGVKRDVYAARDIVHLAGKFANRLREQGFRRQDVIVNTLPNSQERLISDLGIIMAGCVAMNGQLLLTDGSDLLRSARISRCRGVVLCPEDGQPAWRIFKSHVSEDTDGLFADLSCEHALDLTTAICVVRNGPGKQSFLQTLRNSEDSVFFDDMEPDETALILVTSGSTGYSKLVPRTHKEALALFYNMSDVWERKLTAQSKVFNSGLMGWISGTSYGMFTTRQTRVVVDVLNDQDGGEGEDVCWEVICKEKCTSACLGPLSVHRMAKHVQSIGGSNYKLQYINHGGQTLKKSLTEQVFQLAEECIATYGSTEAGMLTSCSLNKNSHLKDFLCGKPNKGVQLRILDGNGKDCPTKQVGHIVAKGPGVTRGYFNRLEDPDPNTAKSFTTDGWFRTEDNGYLDEEGNLYVIGREKDIITYGTLVLYPGWLEQEIGKHPDVIEACIVPVSDPLMDQEICACIKQAKGKDVSEENLKDFIESLFVLNKELDTDSVPMPKFFLKMDEFPEVANGKTNRRLLTTWAEEKFGHRN